MRLLFLTRFFLLLHYYLSCAKCVLEFQPKKTYSRIWFNERQSLCRPFSYFKIEIVQTSAAGGLAFSVSCVMRIFSGPLLIWIDLVYILRWLTAEPKWWAATTIINIYNNDTRKRREEIYWEVLQKSPHSTEAKQQKGNRQYRSRDSEPNNRKQKEKKKNITRRT